MDEDVMKEFNEEISNLKTPDELEIIKNRYLGKKGIIKNLMENIKNISDIQQKKEYGEKINKIKKEIEKKINILEKKIREDSENQKLLEEEIDETLPGYPFILGKKHILTKVEEEITEVFLKMGFSIYEGPEIETDYYNFEALNMPKYHPARDMWDTLFLPNGLLLRTHTSPVQIRVMEKIKPPFRLIAPGRCYRRDPFDATHSPIFYQIEGLMIDRNTTLADLMGILDLFAKRMFGEETKTKFYLSYFPFVEPGIEVAATCSVCKGKGCSVCKYTGFVEILGAGMVHPKVLSNVGIDPDIYQGFAFGLGVERVAMIKYGISDIRLFYENDIRFLNQF
ncbi:MAG TPA: phenylalanine--tRNA ligase subunit alpha [Caldisericia bacterium]|nr:phenylalanine--tRNA ligase subunit alpha [Caldisericia bacterium]HOL83089.1 phenylalanine--tRNA ligase subunit alpha [Caldisericia bacterium]HON84162.1 phenylalanine--tRNA ligase subunit alpha [Caldisericia bacterium]HPP42999.1 phenylalanine--tRNA ligase subunit alpha [Caldisericia bacterium]HRT37369.1 phenylalanine--tRNA ligase subunit alpha [Caldisericia bacterium]